MRWSFNARIFFFVCLSPRWTLLNGAKVKRDGRGQKGVRVWDRECEKTLQQCWYEENENLFFLSASGSKQKWAIMRPGEGIKKGQKSREGEWECCYVCEIPMIDNERCSTEMENQYSCPVCSH